jgi:hypothetical protein
MALLLELLRPDDRDEEIDDKKKTDDEDHDIRHAHTLPHALVYRTHRTKKTITTARKTMSPIIPPTPP